MALRYVFVTLTIFILSLLIWTPTAHTQSISCANVRCAGSCVDTPGGPVCEPQRLTCASTLCAQGNQCVETQSGPQCVPNTSPQYNYQPHYDYNLRPWTSQRRQQLRHPSYRDWTAWYNRGIYNKPYYNYPQYTPNFPGTNFNSCSYEYVPVCAQKTVQCFGAPCPPLQKTFGNKCAARVEGYSVVSQGVCP